MAAALLSPCMVGPLQGGPCRGPNLHLLLINGSSPPFLSGFWTSYPGVKGSGVEGGEAALPPRDGRTGLDGTDGPGGGLLYISSYACICIYIYIYTHTHTYVCVCVCLRGRFINRESY